MKRVFLLCVATVLALAATTAMAAFHLFRIEQIYSNANGTVQFVVLVDADTDGEHLWKGEALIASGPGQRNVFTFPVNLPSAATAGKRVLVASQGFAALGIVTPDYVVPNGFLAIPGGTLNYAFVDQFTYTALPTDGVNALYRVGGSAKNLATNFAGASASVSLAPPVAPNFEGLWYAAPAESESGWGVNFAHQGDVIFLTWFTYDLTGKAWWLTMSANKTADGVYSGTLLETHGPAFNAVPFSPAAVTVKTVGTGTLTFANANNGSFAYTVNGVTQTKAITRQIFGPLPTCVWGAQPNLALASNFQDIWYAAPAESESGWGVNFTHQGDNIFATWFTYGFDGAPLWLVATAAKTGSNVYSGTLLQTRGPAFNAVPFLPANVVLTPVGTLTIAFANGNSATYAYTVTLPGQTGVTQTKTVTRQVFRAPGTVCN